MARTEHQYQSGIGNEFATEAVTGRAAGGAETLRRRLAARPLHRAAERHGVHRAARDEPANVDVSHSAIGDA